MKSAPRKPTYGAAIRLARITGELFSQPYGWSFKSIQRELGISERTLARYVAVLRSGMAQWQGAPRIEVVGEHRTRKLRLASAIKPAEPSSYQVALLYFSMTVLKFLEGTVLKEGVEGLWKKIFSNLNLTQQTRLLNLERKFYAVLYTPKDYANFSEQLDVILRALIDQNRLRIEYAALSGEAKTHDFEPYSLIAYRGGLYLLGRSDRKKTLIYLAIERMRRVDFAHGDDGALIRFPYPRSFTPESYTDGAFGIVDGPETAVELLIHSEQTESYVRSRTVHRTQRFVKRSDGKMIMTMSVRGTVELANWIMSMSPWIEVLKPAALRKDIAGRHASAACLYERKSSRNATDAEPLSRIYNDANDTD
jgi:predicted DNA-binding transcriptional regulator YafY